MILRQQRGVTLVELLVGLVVGLVLIAAVISIFAGSRQTYNEIQRLTTLQENLRFATDFMTRDIRQAGFGLGSWGSLVPPEDPDIDFGAGAFMVEWLAEADDRDCMGSPLAAGTAIQHTYAVIEDSLTCTRDGATTILIRDVTGLQRELITDSSGSLPLGLSIRLIFETSTGGETFAHEAEFIVAFRNSILNVVNL